MTNYYVHGLGLPYEMTETWTNWYQGYYQYGYRGSTVALTDGGAQVTDRFEYSAYGTLAWRIGTDDTPFLFDGRYGVQTDPNGLLYMRARYYNPYICRFLNPDPLGLGGGLNLYVFAGGNPVSLIDPFGLLSWKDVGEYFQDVGQVWVGYADAVVSTVGGLAQAVSHPVQTVEGLGYAVAHPVTAFNAAYSAVGASWDSGLRGLGRIVGEVLIAAAFMGAGKAVATAGKAGDIVGVSRWGRAGLMEGDFVQLGGVSIGNYLATGKWSSLGGNQVAAYASGVSYTVPSAALHWPSGIDAVKGVLGQRIYDPGRVAMSYATASTVGTAAGATVYGTGLAGQASVYALWGEPGLGRVLGK